MNPITVLAVVALVGWVILKRLRGGVYQAKSQVVPAVIVGAIGVSDLPAGLHPAISAYALAAFSLALSLVFGAARGSTVQLGEQDGLLHARYRISTLVLWLTSIATSVGLRFAVPSSTAAGTLLPHLLTIGIAAGVLAEAAVVIARGVRRPHVIAWSVKQGDEDDLPVVRRAAVLDSLHDRATKTTASSSTRWE